MRAYQPVPDDGASGLLEPRTSPTNIQEDQLREARTSANGLVDRLGANDGA